MRFLFLIALSFILFHACDNATNENKHNYDILIIDRDAYYNKLYGFWLGQSIANWTGLVTEMDKIGNIGDIKTGNFYTYEDWGKPDQPSIWGEGIPSNLSKNIDFVFRDTNEIWGADDDTDIEYMYQYLHFTNETSILTPEQIREGWLKHMKYEEENYLWVSNQRALDLMYDGFLPPETGYPANNEHFDMIDAQLTTEIFGLFSPGRPDMAVKISRLPIKTTSSEEAEIIANYYVVMHSLASLTDTISDMGDKLMWMATEASKVLPENSYPNSMFHYVLGLYNSGISWERARDSIYYRYQVNEMDGYNITSRNLYCNGCFAAGINFAASLVSLFYGEGDLKETIKIGTLTGWDSDNPTATWGGLIGFMIGKDGVEKTFDRTFSNKFNIHRTRQNFPNKGIDTFENMANMGLAVVDMIVVEQLNGDLDSKNNIWIIPLNID